ncbi:unnamed protein product [Cyprideis torosa]|uniref:Glycoside hydrolase family 31 TIM barrel domain-containing protein n=1 Tax=Cyprideis torosa TaxID=163714 RepID=A0A7R8W6N0_9CRUS|nr:unnamed protein product [Cyprideis torosa]CAG0882499.1 unnamed protein product [Cyprideis torosa]
MFDTSRSPLIFEDQFLQLTTSLPTTDAYGMGENVHESFLHDFDAAKVFPIFARDEPPTDGDKNAYGTHPFYEVFEEDGSLHGVLFFNSNPQEYTFFKEDGQIPSLTLRAIGGIFNFHLFTGPTFDLVSQQYTEVIGRPMLPPYWSLGFQLSKWNYLTLDKFREVVERNRYAGIPQDVQYGDIDYMDTFKIFTYNQQDWNGFPEYIRDIKQRLGMKFIPILDPALVIDFTDNYPPGKRGWELLQKHFTGLSRKQGLLVGKLRALIDGSRSFIDYDVHNLYGWFHTLSAIEGARQATQKRSLVVTRSTFVSSGRYAGHWFGDNVSRWTDLRRSIILMFEFKYKP